MPNEAVKDSPKAKQIKFPQMIFFSRKTTNKIFMYKLAHFILQNFKKFLDTIQSYEDVPFLGSKQPISLEQNFFGTKLYCFHLPIGTFHCANILKNSFRGSRDLRMHHFWARNGPFAPNKNIFGKLLLFSSTY